MSTPLDYRHDSNESLLQQLTEQNVVAASRQLLASLTVISIQAEFFVLRIRHLSIHCWNVPSHMIPTNNSLSVSCTKSQRIASCFLSSLGSAVLSFVCKYWEGVSRTTRRVSFPVSIAPRICYYCYCLFYFCEEHVSIVQFLFRLAWNLLPITLNASECRYKFISFRQHSKHDGQVCVESVLIPNFTCLSLK